MKKTGWRRAVGGSPLAVAKFVSGGFEPAETAASVTGHRRSLPAGPLTRFIPGYEWLRQSCSCPPTAVSGCPRYEIRGWRSARRSRGMMRIGGGLVKWQQWGVSMIGRSGLVSDLPLPLYLLQPITIRLEIFASGALTLHQDDAR